MNMQRDTLLSVAFALLALAAALLCLELARGLDLRPIIGGLVLVLIVHKTAAAINRGLDGK